MISRNSAGEEGLGVGGEDGHQSALSLRPAFSSPRGLLRQVVHILSSGQSNNSASTNLVWNGKIHPGNLKQKLPKQPKWFHPWLNFILYQVRLGMKGLVGNKSRRSSSPLLQWNVALVVENGIDWMKVLSGFVEKVPRAFWAQSTLSTQWGLNVEIMHIGIQTLGGIPEHNSEITHTEQRCVSVSELFLSCPHWSSMKSRTTVWSNHNISCWNSCFVLKKH